jgi:DNA-binding response OmpR family regulator
MNAQDQAQIKILVVTEDPIARESASAILKEAGYAIHSALEGKDWADSAGRSKPALILMDAQDIENYRRMKADSALGSIPVVFMISDFGSRVIADDSQSGVADFVCKPLNAMELKWRIDRLMKLHPTSEGQSDAQKYKDILETTADVCHKLNQPLQYVMGTVQLLLMDMSTEDKLFDRLDMIRQKAELMGDITRKLTALTRHGAES